MKRTLAVLMALVVLLSAVMADDTTDSVTVSFKPEDTKYLAVGFTGTIGEGNAFDSIDDTPSEKPTVTLKTNTSTFIADNTADPLNLWIKSIGYTGVKITLSLDKPLSQDGSDTVIPWTVTVGEKEIDSPTIKDAQATTGEIVVDEITNVGAFFTSKAVTVATTSTIPTGITGEYKATLTATITDNSN